MAAFRELLESRQDSPDSCISASDTWHSIEACLSSAPTFVACPPPQRLAVWASFLQGLLSEEKERWAAEDRARYRAERHSALLPIAMFVGYYIQETQRARVDCWACCLRATGNTARALVLVAVSWRSACCNRWLCAL
jgi:hypothetical protein